VNDAPYIDTSALAKWYFNEARSDEFVSFLVAQGAADISRLTAVELNNLVQRRRRTNDIDDALRDAILATFDEDVRKGFLLVHTLEDRHAVRAIELLERLSATGLRALDAIHLAIAVDIEATVIATADRIMANAAAALNLQVERFD
jgi:predicted nucleic acid-binding protein